MKYLTLVVALYLFHTNSFPHLPFCHWSAVQMLMSVPRVPMTAALCVWTLREGSSVSVARATNSVKTDYRVKVLDSRLLLKVADSAQIYYCLLALLYILAN